jgi:hypothetical protein
VILQGGGDHQVTPQEDFSCWQAGVAQDSRVKLVAYPGLSHLFMPAAQPPPADYDKPDHVMRKCCATSPPGSRLSLPGPE